MAPRKNSNLFSKADVANLLKVTSQTFANWQARDSKFPEPTYSNRSGNVALYSSDDVQKIHRYVTQKERERLDALDRDIAAALTGAPITELEGQSSIDDADAEFDAAAPDANATPPAEEPKPVEESKSAPVTIKAEDKPEPVKEAPKAETPKAEAKAEEKELVGAGAPAAKAEEKPETKAPAKARGSVLNKRS